jgi:dTDP-4-dehydrorhamnose 3,5-epimerase
MIFEQTPLTGAYVIRAEKLEDDRGFFARVWCRHELEAHGLNPRLAQASISRNRRKATLRGMHYQAAPYEEAKVVRCTRGAIYDAIVDLRKASPTFRRWFGLELTADNYTMLYIPEGIAHGFQTLVDDTEVTYLISEFFNAQAARGLRYDDPAFGITWPLPVAVISDKDRSWPPFNQGKGTR